MRIQGDKVVMVDCDDTLAMWDLSKYPELPRVDVNCYGSVKIVLNQKNINLVKKLSKMGYRVVVWSQTGQEWAEEVVKAAGLTDFVALTMSKPRFYIDDLPSHVWMGSRIWRDPMTGNSNWEDQQDGH